jgi:FkbH-like protein
MVRIPFSGGINPYVVRITFKRWAKLWATARANVYPLVEADRREQRDLQIASWLHKVPVEQAQTLLIRKRYSWKKRMALQSATQTDKPNCLMLECYNPGAEPVAMTFTVRVKDTLLPFQAQLIMLPGFNRHRIGVEQIGTFVDLRFPLDMDLAPNDVRDTSTLYFGAFDFVKDAGYKAPGETSGGNGNKRRICKCVVWDLDNTLWSGTLIEDGLQRLVLKPGVADILKSLDERGILISAVSKNNHDEAMEALRTFGLEDYFLFPQISWAPKSEGIRTIASELNIGQDSLLFIDDSEFEREQVQSQCPEIAVLDARQYKEVLNRPDTQIPVTEDGRKRRQSYRDQQAREGARKNYSGDYEEFLRSCRLRLSVRSLTEANLERVHELTQRTNQMNFSGNRYTREQLRKIATDPEIQTFVMDCEDRFGNYGTVGFSIVNATQRRMTDLMFSCRVQGKRVEHAFLNHLLRKYWNGETQTFFADYRKTPRNAPSGKVFEDLGFVSEGENDGTSRMRFPENREPREEGIVQIAEIADKDRAPQRTDCPVSVEMP